MRLPSKLRSFSESSFADLVPILSRIESADEGISVIQLHNLVASDIGGTSRFIEALTIAFAAGAITLDEETEVLRRAE